MGHIIGRYYSPTKHYKRRSKCHSHSKVPNYDRPRDRVVHNSTV